MIYEQAKRWIFRHKFIALSTVVYIAISLFCMHILFGNVMSIKTRTDEVFSATTGEELYLYDNVEPLGPLIRNPEQVQAVKRYYADLVTDNRFKFYERIGQPISVGDFKGIDKFGYGYEHGGAVNIYEMHNVHVNTVYVQNPGPNYGDPAGSWWNDAPTQIAEVIRDYGCAITCVGMVASDNFSNYGPSHPYGVFLTNSRYFGSDATLVQKTSAQWDDLARDYGLPAPLPGVISLTGYSAVSKALTLEHYLSQGYYPIVKLAVPGKTQHWILFYGSGSIGQASEKDTVLLEQLRLEGGELIPFVYDHPEESASAPLEIVPETVGVSHDKQTAYDDRFMIHDPNKSAGPYINFTQNSKGATLEHCTVVKLMRR